MKYYIMSLFNGWHEVSEDQYLNFIQHIEKNSGASESMKKQIIERRTRKEGL